MAKETTASGGVFAMVIVIVIVTLLVALPSCSSSSSTRESINMITEKMTMTVKVIDCDGATFESTEGEVVRFNTSVNISNCIFNNSHVEIYSPEESNNDIDIDNNASEQLVVTVRDCWFFNTTLLVKGKGVSQVEVDTTVFINNSTLSITNSEQARVVVSNSQFTDSNRRGGVDYLADPHHSAFVMVGGTEVQVLNCSFSNNPHTMALKLISTRECDIQDSNFTLNYLSLYTTCVSTSLTRCQFFKNVDAVGVIVSILTDVTAHHNLDIQDSSFTDNSMAVISAVSAEAYLSISRTVFRNNGLKEGSRLYTNGAAISTEVVITPKYSYQVHYT